MHTLYLVHSSPQMKCRYSSRPKKVPTMYSLFNGVTQKITALSTMFYHGDVGSVYLLVAIVSMGFFVTIVLVEFVFFVVFLAEFFSKGHVQSLCSAAKVY